MVMTDKELYTLLNPIAQKHNLHCRAIYDISGGRGWINFKRTDVNDYMLQLSTPDSFEIYNETKNEIIEVFERIGAILATERDYGKRAFGFQKELTFMDAKKYDELKQVQASELEKKYIGTQINGDITMSGGNFNSGSAENMEITINSDEPDKKWFQKEIVKMILSFISGVGATILGQWLLRVLGWIQ